jgi:hypothetical protein
LMRGVGRSGRIEVTSLLTYLTTDYKHLYI